MEKKKCLNFFLLFLLPQILKQVWPNANHFARNLVKETIEPNVALALSQYKMHGFRFDRIILGTIPPRIGGVKIYDKNVDRNEIIMDIDLFYASDCDINFYLGGVKGGIKDFQIHGWVRVVMKPLIRSMPLVGGLQIFFLNNPNIDFNLVGVIDFMDMPGLSDLLRRIIVEQIGNVMVLPNKLPISLSNEVSAVSLKMPEPEVSFVAVVTLCTLAIAACYGYCVFCVFAGSVAHTCCGSKKSNEEGHQCAG